MVGATYDQNIIIGEHHIKLPPLPKNKEDILFIDEKDAYWRRDLLVETYRQIWFDFIPYHTKIYQAATLYDQDGVLTHLNKEDSDYILRTYQSEMKKRNDGVFVKINKKIYWFPGDYWFVLMECKTKRPDKKGDYFDFRFFQLEDAILCWYVEHNPKTGGLAISKPKKTGLTNLRWLYILNKATKTKNANYGAMNIDQEKCAKTFRDHFMYAYNGLSNVWKVRIKSKSETDGKIVFGKKYSNTKGFKIDDGSDELNTTVMSVPTVVHAFDVDVFEINWYDEYPKMPTDFGEIYRSNEGGTALQDMQVGKKWLTSYTPEGESPSFLSAKDIYYNSELRTITPYSDGVTKSGMICHHIPAYQSWSSEFDKYGFCREKEAMDKIVQRRAALAKNPRELQAEVRKYANTKKEAWLTGGAGTVFDNLRLAELSTDVEEEERESPIPLYGKGKLEWKNKLWEVGNKDKRPKGVFGAVEFVPLTDDELMRNEEPKIHYYNEIPTHLQNYALQQGRDEWGCLRAPLIYPHIMGADPTQHAAASEVIEGSKNAYICMSRFDERTDSIMRRVASKIIMLEYYYRPELPDEAFEDLVKMIIFTGSLVVVEANVPEFATRLIAEGLGNYMLVKNEDGVLMPWERWMGLAHETDKKYHLIRTTANNQESRERLETFVRLIKSYIAKVNPGEKDYGKTLKSLRLFKQLMNLDVADTKRADLFMAWGYCLMADEIYSGLQLMEMQNKHMGNNEVADVLAALIK